MYRRPLGRWSCLLCLTLLLAGCAAFRPQLAEPNISLVGVEIQELGLFRQRYLLTLSVQNPNAMAIPVRGMSYTLQVAGADFAKGVSPRAFTVPGYGETDVQVEMTTNLVSTLGKVQELLAGKRKLVDYQLNGRLEVDLPFVSSIPFRTRGEFRLTE